MDNRQEKSHRDYINTIGGTHFTCNSFVEKQWNLYYRISEKNIVEKMLGNCRNKIMIDVGTSYGHWYHLWKSKRFSRILGVEMDPGRAASAKKKGFDEIFNCDAQNIPLPDESVDVAVSNDVFVHILRVEDRIAVLREVERILRPGGIFVVNHAISRAFGYSENRVVDHCSFVTLHDFLDMVLRNSLFKIQDVSGTYYNFRNSPPPVITRFFRKLISFPGVFFILFLLDFFHQKMLSVEESDYVYLKLQKPI